MRIIGTLAALNPNENMADYYLPRYNVLSCAQKQAVACFLDALAELVELDVQDQTIVERAMRYWCQFLPTQTRPREVETSLPVRPEPVEG